MKPELLVAIIGAITTLLGYGVGKRKRAADAQQTELDSVEKAISIWRGLANDLKREVDELRVQVEQLRDENKELHDEIDRLKRTMDG